MSERQAKFLEAMKEFSRVTDREWSKVVDLTNELAEAIAEGRESFNAINPETFRVIDEPALRAGWIYNRLEQADGNKRHTRAKIRKALGYTDLMGRI